MTLTITLSSTAEDIIRVREEILPTLRPSLLKSWPQESPLQHSSASGFTDAIKRSTDDDLLLWSSDDMSSVPNMLVNNDWSNSPLSL
jgi:hypothetical protein